MSDSKLAPYGDIKVKIREYTDKDGKTKGVYATIGTLFATPHFSRISIKLDTMPIGGDGWLNVYPRDDAPQVKSDTQDDEDKQIDLSEIPF